MNHPKHVSERVVEVGSGVILRDIGRGMITGLAGGHPGVVGSSLSESGDGLYEQTLEALLYQYTRGSHLEAKTLWRLMMMMIELCLILFTSSDQRDKVSDRRSVLDSLFDCVSESWPLFLHLQGTSVPLSIGPQIRIALALFLKLVNNFSDSMIL